MGDGGNQRAFLGADLEHFHHKWDIVILFKPFAYCFAKDRGRERSKRFARSPSNDTQAQKPALMRRSPDDVRKTGKDAPLHRFGECGILWRPVQATQLGIAHALVAVAAFTTLLR